VKVTFVPFPCNAEKNADDIHCKTALRGRIAQYCCNFGLKLECNIFTPTRYIVDIKRYENYFLYRKINNSKIYFLLYLYANKIRILWYFLLLQLKKNPAIEILKIPFGLSQHTMQTTFHTLIIESHFPFSESDISHYTKQGKAIRQKLLVSVSRT